MTDLGRLLRWLGGLALAWPLLETLSWWRLWGRRAARIDPQPGGWSTALVFLTGISDYAATALLPAQQRLLRTVANHIRPDICLVEPFPFETETAARCTPWDLWRRLGYREPPLAVMSLRNLWQTMLVTWLGRWYGAGVARCLVNRLGRPAVGSRPTLLIVCGSAGAAMALAAAPALESELGARMVVVAYGGVFGGGRGWGTVSAFYQLVGRRDGWSRLGGLVFPGRWWPGSALARAWRAGRYWERSIGPQAHFGPAGYLGERAAYPGGPSCYTLTMAEITAILRAESEAGARDASRSG